MKNEVEKLLKSIEDCREGYCFNCPYFKTFCTDDLIDDCYALLIKIRDELARGENK